jgi:hypothetical protein
VRRHAHGRLGLEEALAQAEHDHRRLVAVERRHAHALRRHVAVLTLARVDGLLRQAGAARRARRGEAADLDAPEECAEEARRAEGDEEDEGGAEGGAAAERAAAQVIADLVRVRVRVRVSG